MSVKMFLRFSPHQHLLDFLAEMEARLARGEITQFMSHGMVTILTACACFEQALYEKLDTLLLETSKGDANLRTLIMMAYRSSNFPRKVAFIRQLIKEPKLLEGHRLKQLTFLYSMRNAIVHGIDPSEQVSEAFLSSTSIYDWLVTASAPITDEEVLQAFQSKESDIEASASEYFSINRDASLSWERVLSKECIVWAVELTRASVDDIMAWELAD